MSAIELIPARLTTTLTPTVCAADDGYFLVNIHGKPGMIPLWLQLDLPIPTTSNPLRKELPTRRHTSSSAGIFPPLSD
ncbi:uncharacterized protein EAE98_001108 [Botrytis deweyae]|uniref:Uncharacterized protein n=1 Tax=Botrytis deweyae TaxID=2478750 RepID=A0ABQ7J0K0_9HELO|nr:uncharacterized protein EAE98_001108 [Botrytis deweyae]KAF7938770.1 hypothetical protein EAE98_001108 [Botrytis deweyae]